MFYVVFSLGFGYLVCICVVFDSLWFVNGFVLLDCVVCFAI